MKSWIGIALVATALSSVAPVSASEPRAVNRAMASREMPDNTDLSAQRRHGRHHLRYAYYPAPYYFARPYYYRPYPYPVPAPFIFGIGYGW